VDKKHQPTNARDEEPCPAHELGQQDAKGSHVLEGAGAAARDDE
jgi:hypothetical protein